MSLEEWFVEPRDDDASADFYTLLQAGFYRAYELRGIQLSKHNMLDYRRLTHAPSSHPVPYTIRHCGLPYM